MASGQLVIGYDSRLAKQAEPIQVIQNDQKCNALLVENRYAGPVAVVPSDNEGGNPLGQATYHVPPLTRCIFPWPTDAWATVISMQRGDSNVLFHAANVAANSIRWQASTFRYTFIDTDAVGMWPLAPVGSGLMLSRQVHPVTQGANAQLHHVAPDPTLALVGITAVRLWDGQTTFFNKQAIPPDTRIMRYRVVAESGTGQLADLDVTVWYELNNSGQSGASTRIFGSTALMTTEHNSTMWIECPGALGVQYDMDGGAAGVTALITAQYELFLPYD